MPLSENNTPPSSPSRPPAARPLVRADTPTGVRVPDRVGEYTLLSGAPPSRSRQTQVRLATPAGCGDRFPPSVVVRAGLPRATESVANQSRR